ncbi:alpha/beta fold hydrolase [Dermatobacter hominis]|uniref:alpha/beta fold hydrolase n=1 Tax=Dermatobacter hominis TaxID=2884263 RepID=UPI001D118499|nr:alpha/beta hydrolase [Dermatobacter hominis]UDY34798.1 alpha/beta hydrolase [Dermatobacter hominis]
MSDPTPATVDAELGTIEYADVGSGDPVLFVHGSPGGSDQGELMTRFLVAAGRRVIAPSRPGYLGTALTDANSTPAAQAELHLALLDALGIDRVAVMCWSGGGPSTYLLASGHPERVSAIAALAAVSGPFTFKGGLEDRLLSGRLGPWLVDEMAKHSGRSLVKSTLAEEGDLGTAELKELVEQVWDDPTKRSFVLELSATVAGRKVGLDNDHRQFPELPDLGLAAVSAPVLLVHGTADADVPPAHSDHALAALPEAELLSVDGGTHLAAWTDPTSDAVQARIADALSAG